MSGVVGIERRVQNQTYGDFKAIPYNETRMREALVSSGVAESGLEGYIEVASDARMFYDQSHEEGRISADVLENKYLDRNGDEKGPLHMWDRIARTMASVETPESQDYWYGQFLSVLKDFRFVPGGRIMHGAGREEVRRRSTLSNCYVIPIEWGYDPDKLAEIDIETRNVLIES